MPKEQVKDMALTFIVTYDNFGAKVDHPLKEGGEQAEVTGDNIQEFQDLYVEWYFNSSISEQYGSFYKGFCKVLDDEARNVSLFFKNKAF